MQFSKFKILLFILICSAILVRFINFNERITFGPEQAISLLVSADYINEKFSLLGLPSTQRFTSTGHNIFYPPIFNYSLIPLLLLFNYEVILITGFFALLNIFTGLLLYYLTQKYFNKIIALFAALLFLFNSVMVEHSLFIWSVNYIPLLNLLVLWILFLLYKRKNVTLGGFWLGLLVSLSLGIEYIYLFTGVPVFILGVKFAKEKIRWVLEFLAGGVLGAAPTVLFDILHDFYHLRTLWQYLLDFLAGTTGGNIKIYHFLQFWPLLAIAGGYLLFEVYRRNKLIAILLIGFYIIYNLGFTNVNFTHPTGMYPNLNLGILQNAASNIAERKPVNFNVVMTFDFDSRAYPLRYLLKYNHNLKPEDVENYPNANELYVLTTKDYPVFTTTLFEISSFKPEKEIILNKYADFVLYKLTRD